jgi:outer membrane protein assembly factor BamB
VQPVRINYWGLMPITKRRYLLALAFELVLAAICVAVVLRLGWPPLSTLWRQPPTPPRPVPWFWFYASFYRILLLCLIAQGVDVYVILRAFARKEAEERAPERLRETAAGGQKILRSTALCLLLNLTAATAMAQEWTRFRGPNGSGLSPAAIPARWTDKDVNWKVKLPGRGHSSPVLWGQRIFVTCGEDKTGRRLVVCLRAEDGKQLWLREYPGMPYRQHQDNSYASATPAVDKDHVYVTWGNPREYLVAALTHDGKEVWRRDLGPYRAGHGFGASPIVHEDLLIVPNDQDGPSTLAALDCATGKIRWEVARQSKYGYATPSVYQPPGRPAELIVVSYDQGVAGIEPSTGRTLWQRDVFSKAHVEAAIASPIVAGDLVVSTAGYLGVRYEVIALQPYAAKHTEPVYRLERGAPLVPTPLIKDDLLFLWNDRGVVTCADARSGKVFWQERVPGSFYGSPVCAGDNLYCISREGDVVVLAASRKFDLRPRNPLGEGSHSTPAVAGGAMYLRTFGQLVSVGRAAKR